MTAPVGLPEPRTAAGREGLAALLAAPAGALVAFDFDGTLAPVVPDPAAARAHPDAVRRLSRLAERVGQVAVVTGRPARVAVELAGFADAPGLDRLVVLGHYGLERWDAATGQVAAPAAHPGVPGVRRELPALLAELGVEAVAVEDKGRSVAAHTRNAPDPAGTFERLQEPLARLAQRHGLVVEPGRYVLELRPPGVDKGQALRSLVDASPGGGPSAVVFAGDDLGDLAAFDAVDALRAEGVPGLLVCSGSDEVTVLAERADVVVDGPDGLMAWLESLDGALSRRG